MLPFHTSWLLESGWQLGMGSVSQKGSSFCSFAEATQAVLKHRAPILALNFACVPSHAAKEFVMV